jgi:hypothetical protein
LHLVLHVGQMLSLATLTKHVHFVHPCKLMEGAHFTGVSVWEVHNITYIYVLVVPLTTTPHVQDTLAITWVWQRSLSIRVIVTHSKSSAFKSTLSYLEINGFIKFIARHSRAKCNIFSNIVLHHLIDWKLRKQSGNTFQSSSFLYWTIWN